MEIEDSDYDEILKDSSPYKIYEELNKQVKNVTDDPYCSEFKNLKQDYKDKSVELCKKVTQLLDFVFKKDKSKEFKDYCSHYKYWVYQEVRNLFNGGTSDSDIQDVIKKFNKLQTDLFTKHGKRDCSYRFDIENLQGLNYKVQEKYLYDYFKNYNNIKTSETCNKCKNGKYKEYLEGIKSLYENEKENCCFPETWDCSNYFLTCKSEFDPSKLLSAFLSKGNGSCDGLSSITANFDEEKLNSVVTDQEVLNSITHGACINLNNSERASDNTTQQNFCLLAASAILTRNVPTDGIDRPEMTDRESPLRTANSGFREDLAEGDLPKRDALQEGQLDAKGKGGDSPNTQVNGKVLSNRVVLAEYRWSFKPGGKLDCRSKSKNKDIMRLCGYMDELVEGNFATQIEGTGAYKVQAGRSWTEDDLKLARERLWKRRSANESNILNNIFVRISTGVTLFTPFGSRLRRHRKRQQRYKLDFTDLSTPKRPRRFLKRTYRHSDRRRFNVVNIEDELHSSNDLRNIN
ncbi:PIR Superfamily Protein [Plasmodium malariae]|uniref:PIR Superfamily Protein n=1 Tax=Plasmodium malariae TaxID=5858 RepID=A0A1A8WXV9_PLAMA|nr:PIR Superfamily Protein [Plasmodium malariae]